MNLTALLIPGTNRCAVTLKRHQRGKLTMGSVFVWDGRSWRVVEVGQFGVTVVGELVEENDNEKNTKPGSVPGA